MANSSFAYEAQTVDGQPIRGTIEAGTLDEAQRKLLSLGVRVLKIEPVAEPPEKKPALSGADFLAFNEQLAQLTAAGLPVEKGLRLIAADLRSGKLKSTIESIAEQLEQGKSLDQAFAAHQQQFHPLYAQIVEAGMRSGNLPAVLLSLGRHLETARRLRTELVRAIAYPLMVLLAVGLLMVLLGHYVFPGIISAYQGGKYSTFDFTTWKYVPVDDSLPMITWLVASGSWVLGPIIMVLAVVALAVPLLWQSVPGSSAAQAMDRLLSRVPLVGPVLRKSMISRWLDAMHVAVNAGLDLPRAIDLAGGAVAAPPLVADSRKLVATLEAGRPLGSVGPMHWLPQSVPAVLEVAAEAGNLSQTLAALARSHQQQADQKIAMIPAVLTPILMTIVALLITGVLLALLAPVTRMFQWMLW